MSNYNETTTKMVAPPLSTDWVVLFQSIPVSHVFCAHVQDSDCIHLTENTDSYVEILHLHKTMQ